MINRTTPIRIGNKVIKAKGVSLSQEVSKGNTMEVRPPSMRNRVRSWIFTLNNYTEEDIVSLSHDKWMDIDITRYAFQEEIGENGTPHLQGVVQFVNQIEFTTMKEINNRAHWKKTKSLKGSVKYCTKERTRKEGTLPYLYNIPDKWLWKPMEERDKLIEYEVLLANMCSQMKELNGEIGRELPTDWGEGMI